MNRFVAVACLALAACSREQYGFVATLGNDTTSVEKITRRGNTIVSDVVEHSPRVIRKHWEITRNSDGTIKRWILDKYIANPDSGEAREAHYAADFTTDSVLVIGRNGRQKQAATIKGVVPVTVPWESYVYGNYEILFELAAKQGTDTVVVKQLQPGYGEFGNGLVRKQPDGSVTFVTTGLAGTGVAKLDAKGRMLSYSGKNTTYKQEVVRVENVGDIDAIADRFAEQERLKPVRSLSPRETMHATLDGASIEVDYSRPSVRGRRIVGDVVPYDKVWRTGANAATHFTTTKALRIGELAVPAGTYTLWTLPAANGVRLIVNKQTGQWGTRYDATRDLGRIPLTVTNAGHTEQFTIRIETAGEKSGNLVLEWDGFRWSVPVVVIE